MEKPAYQISMLETANSRAFEDWEAFIKYQRDFQFVAILINSPYYILI